MASRLDLQYALEAFIGKRSDGKQNVYFQPPASFRMVYPCIVYQRDTGETDHADDMPYIYRRKYLITLITTDPDSSLLDRLAYAFPSIEHDRSFTNDNLYHDVFTLFY